MNLINEDQRSVAISERSLEWFEDEFYGVNGLSAECGGTEHEELVVDLGAFRIDHSQVFDATPDSPQASTSLAAGFGLSPKGAKHDSEV
ncbi:unnamed protein product [Toxocara canis]|uniref:Uncharacterized protein n=1 Tax=Toxocara canis TaxID=6265 RepID=A0A3P7GHM6_TOXCA|nr:unnamed protein product [Toxocara canis]